MKGEGGEEEEVVDGREERMERPGWDHSRWEEEGKRRRLWSGEVRGGARLDELVTAINQKENLLLAPFSIKFSLFFFPSTNSI